MKKFVTLIAALMLVVTFPSDAQAAACTSSQSNQIRVAQSAVNNAQRNLGYQQGYLRLQQSSVTGAQNAVRSATRKVDNINKALNVNFKLQAKANRVDMIDLTVAARALNVDLSNAEYGLKQAQSRLDQEQKWLDLKQRRVEDAANVLSQKQSDLARYQSRCSSY